MVDLSRLLLVLALVIAPVAIAAVDLLRRIGRWWLGPLVGRRVASGWRLWLVRFSHGVTIVGLLCLGYGRWVEPFWPVVERVEITSSKLHGSLRVVLLSDLHSDPEVRLEARLPALVAELRPDLILFTGDAINSYDGLDNFKRCMRELAALAPTFAVVGNWEAWWFADADLYGGTGVTLLKGASQRVAVNGAQLWLSGFSVGAGPLPGVTGGKVEDPYYRGRLRRALAGIPEGAFHIFVHHFPEVAHAAVLDGAELGVAGGTHVGQLWLPGIGGLIRVTRAGLFFSNGLHAAGDGWLYVNRGIGMEGGVVPRVRFAVRPEITLFELNPAATDPLATNRAPSPDR